MNILAIDPSLTATGLCLPNGDVMTLTTKHKGMTRLRWIRDRITSEMKRSPVDLIAIEDYSYGSKGSSVVNLGELGGVIRLMLFEAGVPYIEVPPACVKKYATGKGNANKLEVFQQAIVRSGREFPDDNGADAWWIHQLALAHYAPDSPLLVKVPAVNREGLRKVPWVEIGKEAA